MKTILRPAIVLFVLLSLLTGVVYPLLVTAFAQVVFPFQANGSLIAADGRAAGRGGGDSAQAAAGSRLIGQDFSAGAPAAAARWFWGRPSATAPTPYTAVDFVNHTGGVASNMATTNPALATNVRGRIDALAAADAAVGLARTAGGGTPPPLPVDLVTSSGSGLDPHISPAAAVYQAARVARARGLSEAVVLALIERCTTRRTLGVLGEPVVNVLELNLQLEAVSRK